MSPRKPKPWDGVTVPRNRHAAPHPAARAPAGFHPLTLREGANAWCQWDPLPRRTYREPVRPLRKPWRYRLCSALRDVFMPAAPAKPDWALRLIEHPVFLAGGWLVAIALLLVNAFGYL